MSVKNHDSGHYKWPCFWLAENNEDLDFLKTALELMHLSALRLGIFHEDAYSTKSF